MRHSEFISCSNMHVWKYLFGVHITCCISIFLNEIWCFQNSYSTFHSISLNNWSWLLEIVQLVLVSKVRYDILLCMNFFTCIHLIEIIVEMRIVWCLFSLQPTVISEFCYELKLCPTCLMSIIWNLIIMVFLWFMDFSPINSTIYGRGFGWFHLTESYCMSIVGYLLIWKLSVPHIFLVGEALSLPNWALASISLFLFH